MKHIKLFESFDSSMDELNVGDVVYIKPTEMEFAVVCVDHKMSKSIEPLISVYSPEYEHHPVKLVITDPMQKYVVAGDETSYLVTSEQAIKLSQNPEYIMAELAGNNLKWIENDLDVGNNISYIIPIVKNKIIQVHGQGDISFIKSDILSYFSEIHAGAIYRSEDPDSESSETETYRF